LNNIAQATIEHKWHKLNFAKFENSSFKTRESWLESHELHLCQMRCNDRICADISCQCFVRTMLSWRDMS